MGVSIYYHARRSQPLTKSESTLVKIIAHSGSVDAKIDKYLQTGDGLNWESFTLYNAPTAHDLVLEGATRLPDNTEDAMWVGVRHWCVVLTLLRLAIHDAEWQVTVEDHPLKWDHKEKRYDPST